MAPMEEYDKLEVVTEEVVICKLLTSNDLKVQKRGLSSLKKWFKKISSKKGLQEDDFNRIWRGLFYYFWMSDKPLVQEEAAELISGMVHVLDNFQAAMLYVRGFFSSIAKQWDRISHYRIDKFLMFVRRFLRQILVSLKNQEWDVEQLELFSTELYNAFQVLPYSLALHLNEIFNEEVAKISKGKIPTGALIALYKGFFECIVNLRPSMQVINSIQTNIFGGLARQLKLHIKQKALTEDCVNEKNDEIAASDGEEMNSSALDPRPGGVDVFLPFIEFDEKTFVRFMKEYASKQIPTKARNILTQLISMFASITKLRTTVSDTDKLIREMQDNPKKRKRPKQTLSKLIKKSCRKLEEEDEESETEHDEHIMKKLRDLTDLIQIPAGKSTFTVVQANTESTKPKKTSITNEWTVTETINKLSPPKKAKVSGGESNWLVEETTAKVDEKSIIESNNKSLAIQDIAPTDSERSTEKTEEVIDELDIHLEIADSPINSEKIEFSEKAENELCNVEKSTQLTVSFSEKPAVSYYEKDLDKESQNYDNENEIVVPASVVKARPKLMKENKGYVVVDFQSKLEDDEKLVQEPEKVCIEPLVELETITRVLRSRKVESTPVPSTPDSKRTRKPREKKTESSSQNQSQRKSTRIAEKQKKVLFKLEENTYQDIPTYQKVLKSKPASPFDSSKLPRSGILKPYAVTSPINPFYFANGERKISRKRRKN